MQINGNYIEAVWWFIVAAYFFYISYSSTQSKRKLGYTAAAAFFVFGISDIIETRTGTWWQPWWLLALKASCIAVFAACIIFYYRKRKF